MGGVAAAAVAAARRRLRGWIVLVGILSDSHGRYQRVRRAIELFDRLRVDLIVHCGDVGDVSVFDEMAGRNCRFVWGNTDDPSPSLRAYLRTVGIPFPEKTPLRLDLDGKTALVFHGHERGFRAALRAGQADYIFHGHTHRPRDERIGSVRVINPGALHAADPKTVATLDTAADEVQFHEVA